MSTKEDIVRQKENRLGETNINNFGSEMTIIEYNGVRDITVEFNNGYKTKSVYGAFKIGNIKSPYCKSIYQKGYIGEGIYKPFDINEQRNIHYQYWTDMLKRCYSEKELLKHPTYEDKYVCEEWLNFQTFAKWFDENYYTISGEQICLDKDILFKGNKIYSPETCVFVPQRINKLFIKNDACRGKYPIGVSLFKPNKFRARCSIYYESNNKFNAKTIGYFDTPEKAFYEGYKPFKETYIKQVAEEYKEIIPKELYEAMYRYVVEIDD